MVLLSSRFSWGGGAIALFMRYYVSLMFSNIFFNVQCLMACITSSHSRNCKHASQSACVSMLLGLQTHPTEHKPNVRSAIDAHEMPD
jgi:hypothetical protein